MHHCLSYTFHEGVLSSIVADRQLSHQGLGTPPCYSKRTKKPYPLPYGAGGLISCEDTFARGTDPCCCLYQFRTVLAGIGAGRHAIRLRHR